MNYNKSSLSLDPAGSQTFHFKTLRKLRDFYFRVILDMAMEMRISVFILAFMILEYGRSHSTITNIIASKY